MVYIPLFWCNGIFSAHFWFITYLVIMAFKMASKMAVPNHLIAYISSRNWVNCLILVTNPGFFYVSRNPIKPILSQYHIWVLQNPRWPLIMPQFPYFVHNFGYNRANLLILKSIPMFLGFNESFGTIPRLIPYLVMIEIKMTSKMVQSINFGENLNANWFV